MRARPAFALGLALLAGAALLASARAAAPAPATPTPPPTASPKPAAGSAPAAARTAAPSPKPSPPKTALRFTDATPASGIVFRDVCGAAPAKKLWMTETIGAGAAWLDADRDGSLDLYLVNGSAYDRPANGGEPNKLYKGDAAGKFTDRSAAWGAADRAWGYGVAVGDYDNDGDPDLYVTNLGSDILYRNDGKGVFTDVSKAAGIGDALWGASAAFVDTDGDGDLDIYVANYVDFDTAKVPKRGTPEADRPTCKYRGIAVFCGPMGLTPAQDILWRNNGDGTFTDATRASGVWLAQPRYGLGVVTGDYDNDGDTDLYVANDGVQASLWRNRGDGTFEDVGIQTLAALNVEGEPQAGMGTDFGDYDGDGWLDIVVTTFSEDLKRVYHGEGGKFFSDVSAPVGMQPGYMSLSWGTGFHDFDNDGDLDLFIANGHVYPQVDDYDIGTRFKQQNHLFENIAGKFREVSAGAGSGLAPVKSFRGAAFGDFDNDGDVDILATALDESPVLLRNDTQGGGHFLTIRLEGAGKSNRDAVGARVTVTAAGRTQFQDRKGGGSFLSASDPRLHFGLGAATKAETVEIRWPDGTRQALHGVAADQFLTIRESQ